MFPDDVFSLDIDICDTCNFACIYCYHQDMNGNFISQALMDRIIKYIPKTEKPIRINFFGGEPLLAIKQIKYFIDKSSHLNLSYSMTSNLSKLTEELVEYFKANKVSIHCSIDGNPEIQDSQRILHSGKGTSNLMAKKVGLALEVSPRDNARMTIAPKNIKEYFNSIKYILTKMGFTGCAPIVIPDSSLTKRDYDLLDTELKKTVDWLYDIWLNRGIFYNIKFINDSRPGKKMRGLFMCGAGRGNISIGLGGDLYPCHRFSRADGFGMMWLANIWESNWIKTFHQRRVEINKLHQNDHEMCLHCPAYDACNGGCPHINFTTGTIDTDRVLPPYPFCEIKRREHHWATYFWRKVNNYKLNQQRSKLSFKAPKKKPPMKSGSKEEVPFRDKMMTPEQYRKEYSNQILTREALIEKFKKKSTGCGTSCSC